MSEGSSAQERLKGNSSLKSTYLGITSLSLRQHIKFTKLKFKKLSKITKITVLFSRLVLFRIRLENHVSM